VEVIVEVVSRSQKMIERHRFVGERMTIGRAYDNDLILSEAHVSAHHALFTEDENGQWWLDDLQSENGLMTKGYKPLLSPVKVNSGDEFLLGKVRLKFFAADYPVADALRLGVSEDVIEQISQPLPFTLFLFLSLALLGGYEYLQTFNELDKREFLPRIIGAPLMALFWATLWAFAGRLFLHEPRFFAQCVVSFCYLLLTQLLEIFAQVIAFNSGNTALTTTVVYLMHGALLVLLLSFNLRLATHQTVLGRMATANGLAWGLVLFVWIFSVFSKPQFSNRPEYLGVLQPPYMRWSQGVSLDRFQQDADFIFDADKNN
jgi:hypothetical protein